MKIILEFNTMPENCLDCHINGYETNEQGEVLFCIYLSSIKGKYVYGDFLKRRVDCPLKFID